MALRATPRKDPANQIRTNQRTGFRWCLFMKKTRRPQMVMDDQSRPSVKRKRSVKIWKSCIHFLAPNGDPI